MLTPGEKGMKGALAKAAEILAASEGKGYIMRVNTISSIHSRLVDLTIMHCSYIL